MTISVSAPWQVAEQEYDCQHENVILVRRAVDGGVIHVWKQCQQCGRGLGAASKKGLDIDNLPAWDDELRQLWEDRKQQRASELRAEVAAAFDAKQVDAKAAYREYLRTPEWARVKKLVLQRDNYTCQQCFCKVHANIYEVPNRAEVHHKHYYELNFTGRSWAFECVTLCHKCHREYHGIDRGDDE